MKTYIELNTEKRKEATMRDDKAGKDLFNNAVFGKTMENLWKQINFEAITWRKAALKWIAKPNFQHAKIFCDEVGFAILDHSCQAAG